MLIDAEELAAERAGERIDRFASRHAVRVLNIGGPRGSVQPTAHAYTQQAVACALDALLSD